ncbi:MAG: hypothetical protein P8J45_05035 [Phycisphaerales bacterium]|nr:hypothetical protein [Phycisphaerales bacterium]
MNVVTKIFIVLVSLLAVLMIPLVAVNATGATTLKQRNVDLQSELNDQKALYEAELVTRQNGEAAHSQRARELQQQVAETQQARTADQRMVAQLESSIAGKDELLASLQASLDVFAQTDRAKANLTDALVGELSDVRVRAMAAERQSIELDEALSEVQNQLEVADAARRKLQEEVVRLTDDKDQALGTVAKYVAFVGDLPEARAGATSGGARVPADRDLSSTIIAVRRSADGTLAEINAGSRDGVKDGWVLTITDGSQFIGNLRIIETDVNRATGVVELEDAAARGAVKPGMRAIARKGD